MGTKEKVLDKTDRLIEKAVQVSQTARGRLPGRIGAIPVDAALFAEWQAQSVSLLSKVEGPSGTYLKQFQARVNRAISEDVKSGLGTLRGFRQDVDEDALQRVTDLVAAELFDDFLSQAQHLHSQGYYAAAASVGGAVLERDLRARCQARGFKVKSNDGISSLNQKLVSSQPPEYSPVTGKKIDTWGKIRNEADHGHFAEVLADDVAEMLSGVRKFVESHLP